jgi:hypothetical protein
MILLYPKNDCTSIAWHLSARTLWASSSGHHRYNQPHTRHGVLGSA